jgi:hypothetical protein
MCGLYSVALANKTLDTTGHKMLLAPNSAAARLSLIPAPHKSVIAAIRAGGKPSVHNNGLIGDSNNDSKLINAAHIALTHNGDDGRKGDCPSVCTTAPLNEALSCRVLKPEHKIDIIST